MCVIDFKKTISIKNSSKRICSFKITFGNGPFKCYFLMYFPMVSFSKVFTVCFQMFVVYFFEKMWPEKRTWLTVGNTL